jgi:antitoxin VapB
MALSIRNPETERLARELARRTGESITDAITEALRERLRRERAKPRRPHALADELLEIGRRFAALPVLDDRTPDEILGYDEHGLFER